MFLLPPGTGSAGRHAPLADRREYSGSPARTGKFADEPGADDPLQTPSPESTISPPDGLRP